MLVDGPIKPNTSYSPKEVLIYGDGLVHSGSLIILLKKGKLNFHTEETDIQKIIAKY